MNSILNGENVKLEMLSKKYCENIYNWIVDKKYRYIFSENVNRITEDEIYKELETYATRYVMIFDKNYESPIGFIKSEFYNEIDGYIFIKAFVVDIENNEKLFKESLQIFCNYLFNSYPIRNVYYEMYSYEMNYAKSLKTIGFKIGIKFSKYRYYDGKYFTKYLLILEKERFYK